jgi:hypothetical protein
MPRPGRDAAAGGCKARKRPQITRTRQESAGPHVFAFPKILVCLDCGSSWLPLLTRSYGYYREGFSLRAPLSVLRLQTFQQQAVTHVQASRHRAHRLAIGHALVQQIPVNHSARTAQDLINCAILNKTDYCTVAHTTRNMGRNGPIVRSFLVV